MTELGSMSYMLAKEESLEEGRERNNAESNAELLERSFRKKEEAELERILEFSKAMIP